MKTVAIQGINGAYHDIAIRSYFENEDVNLICCNTFKQVFDAVKNAEDTLGIIAIENTIAGSLMQNYELLISNELFVFGEIKLRISHCLAALGNQKIDDIKEVSSHPIALRQCEDFLSTRNWLVTESEDTAMSAKEISNNKIAGRAAICSTLAAEIYGLNIIAKGIETNKHNFTRFLLLCDKAQISRFCKVNNLRKASLVFTLPHESGSLSQILSILSYYKNNLTKLQSSPIIGREWEYKFFIDLTYDDYAKYHQSLDAISPLTIDLKILGEYQIGKQIKQ